MNKKKIYPVFAFELFISVYVYKDVSRTGTTNMNSGSWKYPIQFMCKKVKK